MRPEAVLAITDSTWTAIGAIGSSVAGLAAAAAIVVANRALKLAGRTHHEASRREYRDRLLSHGVAVLEETEQLVEVCLPGPYNSGTRNQHFLSLLYHLRALQLLAHGHPQLSWLATRINNLAATIDLVGSGSFSIAPTVYLDPILESIRLHDSSFPVPDDVERATGFATVATWYESLTQGAQPGSQFCVTTTTLQQRAASTLSFFVDIWFDPALTEALTVADI